MVSETIVKIALDKLLRHDGKIFSTSQALEDYYFYQHDKLKIPGGPASQAWLPRAIIEKIINALSSSPNSIFLTIASIKRPHESDVSRWIFQYMLLVPSQSRVNLQYIAFGISKKGTFYHYSEKLDKPIILSRHVIDRIFERYAECIIKSDYRIFTFVLKMLSMNLIAHRMRISNGQSNAFPDKVPFKYGHFTLFEDVDEVVVTTYIDEGLYGDDQEFLRTLAKLSDVATGSYVHRFRVAMNNKSMFSLDNKRYKVLAVKDYHATSCGLIDAGNRQDILNPKLLYI